MLGMICGYYLSRFDQHAYARLGHETQSATHKSLAQSLGVPSDSIKNWRDEFDPVHDNPRQGWHKREMYTSRKRVIEAFADLSEREVFTIVAAVAQHPFGHTATEIIQSIIPADVDTDEGDTTFALRGPTGAKAELAFISYHQETGMPARGNLRDCRLDQCGYDFAIETEPDFTAVEVKGLAGQTGGIRLTDKEWQIAQEMGDRYFLAVVRNVGSEPQVSIIRNPSTVLEPDMRLYTTVQVSWSVNQSSLRQAEAERAS